MFWDWFIIASALAGAFSVVDAIPKERIQPIVDATPNVDLHAVAVKLAQLPLRETEQKSAHASALAAVRELNS